MGLQAKNMRSARHVHWVFVLIVLSGCSALRGCVESELELAKTSPLPSWFTLPPQLSREDVRVEMKFYTNGEVKFGFYGPNGLLESEVGQHKWHPITLEKGIDKKPNYSIITVHGVAEVYEQRRQEPLLYIVEAPA